MTVGELKIILEQVDDSATVFRLNAYPDYGKYATDEKVYTAQVDEQGNLILI